MAARFRLVKYYNLPRYMYIYIHIENREIVKTNMGRWDDVFVCLFPWCYHFTINFGVFLFVRWDLMGLFQQKWIIASGNLTVCHRRHGDFFQRGNHLQTGNFLWLNDCLPEGKQFGFYCQIQMGQWFRSLACFRNPQLYIYISIFNINSKKPCYIQVIGVKNVNVKNQCYIKL